MARRAKPGDVLEVTTPDGLIYLHYIGRHPEYGDAVTVCPTKQASRPVLSRDLFEAGYVTFYPAAAAVARDIAAVVGRLPAPGVPKRLRRAGGRTGTRVDNWIIEEGSRQHLKEKLTKEELQLPIAAIWNHEFLLERVSKGWRPESEGGDE